MRYLVIDPDKETAAPVEMPESRGHMDAVLQFAGLEPMSVEHASYRTKNQHYGVVIYDYSFVEAAYKPWGLGYSIYCGPAVIYRVDEGGETTDYDEAHSELPPPRFFKDRQALRVAMLDGQVRSDYLPAWLTEGKDDTPQC
jgi:hypothetical protein